MRRFALLMSLTGLLIAVPARAEDLKTADEVIAKHLEAMGGKEKLTGIKSMRMSGKMIMGEGMEAPSTMEYKRPDMVRVEFTFQGMTGIQAYDGKEGWMVMPFTGKTEPEKMPPDAVELIKDQADIEGPLVNYQDKGHKVELVGSDELEGTPVYKLKVEKKDGTIEHHLIDKDNFLSIGQKTKRKVSGMEMELETSMGDFKEVNGIVLPHSIVTKSSMGSHGISIAKIEINVPIEDSRFAMPAVEKKDEGEKKDEPKEDNDK